MKNASTQSVFVEAQLSEQLALDGHGPNSEEYRIARLKAQQDFAEHVRSLLVPGKKT